MSHGIDPISFAFVGLLVAVSSYLAMRPSRDTDPDNILTGGFAFVGWFVWGFLALAVQPNGEVSHRAYEPLAYLAWSLGTIMLVGTIEEVLQRFDVIGSFKEWLGV